MALFQGSCCDFLVLAIIACTFYILLDDSGVHFLIVGYFTEFC